MRCLLTWLFLLAVAPIAEPAVITGRVLDRAGGSVSHARVRAFHAVPLIEYPPPGTWNGLLADSYSDSRGYFTVRTSSRASLDYLIAEGRGYYSVVHSPFRSPLAVVLRRKKLSPDEEVRRLLKRIHRKAPNPAMRPGRPADGS